MWKAENLPNELGDLAKEIFNQSWKLLPFFLLYMGVCVWGGWELNDALLEGRGLDDFENL